MVGRLFKSKAPATNRRGGGGSLGSGQKYTGGSCLASRPLLAASVCGSPGFGSSGATP
jgi:hypothetical protein